MEKELIKQFEKLNIGVEIEITVLENFTQSQPETIYLGIKKTGIEGAIYIKDCDNYFETKINYIYYGYIPVLFKNNFTIEKNDYIKITPKLNTFASNSFIYNLSVCF